MEGLLGTDFLGVFFARAREGFLAAFLTDFLGDFFADDFFAFFAMPEDAPARMAHNLYLLFFMNFNVSP